MKEELWARLGSVLTVDTIDRLLAAVARWIFSSFIVGRLGSVLTVDTIDHRLAAVARWIFSFFIGSASGLAANASAPVKNPRDPEEMVANRRVADAASLASPPCSTPKATLTILDPCRRTRSSLVLTGPLERLSLERFQNSLPLHQSIL